MKVAFNSLPLKTGHQSRGIGFYTSNLLSCLKETKDIDIQEFSKINEVKKADIVHYPFFDLFQRTLPWQKQIPTVVTIHDVIPLLFPKSYPPGIKGKINFFSQKLSLQNVSAVITDSEASKRDINKFLGISLEKIFVVYLASGESYKKIQDKKIFDQIKNKYHLPEKFSIYLGSVNWNKNILGLTKGSLDAGLDILLVGKDFESQALLDHPERKSYKEWLEKFASNPKVHILGFVPEKDLVGLMNMAEVLLLPSFYEGFGLPILQAQVCGTPVITGNISSMLEVAGEGALLVDPHNIDSITDAVSRILRNSSFKETLITKGFDNVKKFSWEKTASKTINVYDQILSGFR